MPTSNPIQQLNVGEALGGASGAGVMQTDSNGLILNPTTVALSSLANIPTATVLGRHLSGTGPVDTVTMAQLAAGLESSLEARTFDWTALQTFAANLGIVLTPGTDPVSPVSGQIWVRASDGAVMFREPGGASMPLEQTGSWTPVLSPDVVGNFAATYTTQVGGWLKIGRFVWVWLRIVTSSITWTTASGTMRITGLPFPAAAQPGQSGPGVMQTLFGLSLATTAGIMEPKLTISGGGNTSCVFRQTVRGAPTTTGNLALGGTSGFASGVNVTIEGGFWYTTNEA